MNGRDHGGGLDAAIAEYGGTQSSWLDLSTGINPSPYPTTITQSDAWTTLPDRTAQTALTDAARAFWTVPDGAAILAAPGASSLIARLPGLFERGAVNIPTPTYNEHAASFADHGWTIGASQNRVLVHPNNPTGHLWASDDLQDGFTIIDESFCDVTPDKTLMEHATRPNTIILKSFGKFWGLAGLRLGFAIGDPDLIKRLAAMIGPWPVAGPALEIGTNALRDIKWARTTRARLQQDADRLDNLMTQAGATTDGGTSLFRLYRVDDAVKWQMRMARHHIWTRIFPYSDHWIRLGLPASDRWDQLRAAL